MHQWVSYQGRVPYPRPGMVRSPGTPTTTHLKLQGWRIWPGVFLVNVVSSFFYGWENIIFIRQGSSGEGHVSPSDPQRQGWSSSFRFPGQGSVQHPPPVRARAHTHSHMLQVPGGVLWRAAHQAFISTSLSCLLPTPQCPSKTFGTFSSTKDFPDDVIQFARNHPLMYNSVLPMGGRPLFQQVGAGYTFTQITADRVAAVDGYYDVLFIGTGQGPATTTHKTQLRLFGLLVESPRSVPSPYFSGGCAPISFWMLL